MTSIPLDQCARHCHSASTCLSFSYDKDGGRCQLMPRIYVNPEMTNFDPRNVIFLKQDENGICKVPTSIPKGRLLFTDGQVQGSKTEFVCDDFHIPTTDVGVCDPSGVWLGLDNPCQLAKSPPYEVPAVGRILVGSCLVLIATPTKNTYFDVALQKKEDPEETNFGIGAFFQHNGRHEMMIRNTMIKGALGSEEVHVPYWPFTLNQEFNLTICAEDKNYRVFVDEVEMFTYAYRRPISEITSVNLRGDFSLRRIKFLG